VNQLYARYRRDGSIPSLKSAGRPTIDIPLEERVAIRNAKRRFGVGACYLVPIVKRFYGMDTNHMRVYRVQVGPGGDSVRSIEPSRRKKGAGKKLWAR
jgi:hypothetical protein